MGGALKSLNVPPSAATYSAALEGLVGVDEEILRRNPELPPVYAAGIRYQQPPHTVWRYPHDILRDGWGDCEGLSGWRCAELRVSGADPDASVLAYRSSPTRFHAVVARGDGWIEDPSIVCGMREHWGMPWTVREVVEQQRPYPKVAGCVVGSIDDAFADAYLPSFKVVKHAEGYTGVFKLPTADGKHELIANTSISPTAAAAVQKGQNVAALVSTGLNDPYALAELNPYSQQAVQVLADPDVQATMKAGAATAHESSGLLAKPGDFLEQPGVTNVVQQLGPWGAVAAALINNPLARGARHVSHDVFKHIPGIGRLF